MGIYFNPKVYKDGVVFDYDTYNPRSSGRGYGNLAPFMWFYDAVSTSTFKYKAKKILTNIPGVGTRDCIAFDTFNDYFNVNASGQSQTTQIFKTYAWQPTGSGSNIGLDRSPKLDQQIYPDSTFTIGALFKINNGNYDKLQIGCSNFVFLNPNFKYNRPTTWRINLATPSELPESTIATTGTTKTLSTTVQTAVENGARANLVINKKITFLGDGWYYSMMSIESNGDSAIWTFTLDGISQEYAKNNRIYIANIFAANGNLIDVHPKNWEQINYRNTFTSDSGYLSNASLNYGQTSLATNQNNYQRLNNCFASAYNAQDSTSTNSTIYYNTCYDSMFTGTTKDLNVVNLGTLSDYNKVAYDKYNFNFSDISSYEPSGNIRFRTASTLNRSEKILVRDANYEYDNALNSLSKPTKSFTVNIWATKIDNTTGADSGLYANWSSSNSPIANATKTKYLVHSDGNFSVAVDYNNMIVTIPHKKMSDGWLQSNTSSSLFKTLTFNGWGYGTLENELAPDKINYCFVYGAHPTDTNSRRVTRYINGNLIDYIDIQFDNSNYFTSFISEYNKNWGGYYEYTPIQVYSSRYNAPYQTGWGNKVGLSLYGFLWIVNGDINSWYYNISYYYNGTWMSYRNAMIMMAKGQLVGYLLNSPYFPSNTTITDVVYWDDYSGDFSIILKLSHDSLLKTLSGASDWQTRDGNQTSVFTYANFGQPYDMAIGGTLQYGYNTTATSSTGPLVNNLTYIDDSGKYVSNSWNNPIDVVTIHRIALTDKQVKHNFNSIKTRYQSWLR